MGCDVPLPGVLVKIMEERVKDFLFHLIIMLHHNF